MPSTTSSSFSRPLPSSTVITPSLPTFSMASAMMLPTDVSLLAEIVPTWAMYLESAQGVDRDCSWPTTAAAALSMPRFRSIGFMPAATARRPSVTIACARTVAVVVPSPAASLAWEATSFTICAPMFSNLSFSSISFATDTPSLVMVGAPKDFFRMTLRPLGPRVTLTASARMLMPLTILTRAASPNLTSLAAMFAIPLNSVQCLVEITKWKILLFQHAEDFAFGHDQQFLAVDFDSAAGILAEDHLVTGFHIQRTHFAVLGQATGANCDHFTLGRLLGSGARQNDATSSFGFLFYAANHHAIMQRTDFHGSLISI